MQSNITFRPLTADDIPFVLELHKFEHVSDFLESPSEELIHRALERESLAQILVESSGQPMGLIVLEYYEEWLVEFRRLAVARPKRGIGSAAMRWVLDHTFKERRANRVNLEVASRNAVARTLYESHGFVHEGTFREGYRNHSTGAFEDLCIYGLLRREFEPSAPLQNGGLMGTRPRGAGTELDSAR